MVATLWFTSSSGNKIGINILKYGNSNGHHGDESVLKVLILQEQCVQYWAAEREMSFERGKLFRLN